MQDNNLFLIFLPTVALFYAVTGVYLGQFTILTTLPSTLDQAIFDRIEAAKERFATIAAGVMAVALGIAWAELFCKMYSGYQLLVVAMYVTLAGIFLTSITARILFAHEADKQRREAQKRTMEQMLNARAAATS